MYDFKHTPAPWLRDGRTVYALQDSNSRFTDKENRFSAGFFAGRNCSEIEVEANAQLAMTAPELLDVLIQALPHVREQAKIDGHAFGTLQRMCEIIKKAQGEPLNDI